MTASDSASSDAALAIEIVTGRAIEAIVPELARLRIEIFRSFPYLYDGDAEYERAYLQTYVDAPDSVAVVVRAAGRVVGVSTGLPLPAEGAAFRAPFEAAGIDVASVFYCGESVLDRRFRGRGLYARFFSVREAHARALGGFTCAAFCAVVRSGDHPLRPASYAPLDPVWRRFGYVPRPQLVASFAWKDVDADAESEKKMTFWTKALAVKNAACVP